MAESLHPCALGIQMNSQLPAITKTILMVSREHCLADQESAVALHSFLPLRSVRMEIEHLGLNQRCNTAGARRDHVCYQYTKSASPEGFTPDLTFARDIFEPFCILTYGLDFHLISELRSRTFDQDIGLFRNVCIKQYTHFGAQVHDQSGRSENIRI